MGIIKIVVAGEIDSGKSTLIGRLLYDTDSISIQAKEEFKKTCRSLKRDLEFAYLLDSFEEERRDEFTLDTTQALLKSGTRDFLLIDVPGHKALLGNMLTGSSYADAAILVVDIKKPIEEQNKRHLYILNFLGINIIAVAINKIDVADYGENEFVKAKEQINNFLNELGIKIEHVIPVSAKKGDNLFKKTKLLNWYKGFSLIEALNTAKNKENEFDFRFPVQDVYENRGEKICVGKVSSGKASKGDLLNVLPLNKAVKLKAINAFQRSKQEAISGESVGLILDPSHEIKRGQIICSGRPPILTDRFKAKIFCLNAINFNEVLSVCCATQEVYGKVVSLEWSMDTASWKKNNNQGLLKALDAAEVTIETDKPIVVEKFVNLPALGRLILKKDNDICAIGSIE